MIPVFYAPARYEEELTNKYNFAIKKKQEEIDEVQRMTRKLQKYTAKAYISKPERIFCVEEDGKIYFEDVMPENICPAEAENDAVKYILDMNFELYILRFIKKHKKYKVIFFPDGKYGPTVYYDSEIGAIPARFESYDGDILEVNDETKYDICVG